MAIRLLRTIMRPTCFYHAPRPRTLDLSSHTNSKESNYERPCADFTFAPAERFAALLNCACEIAR